MSNREVLDAPAEPACGTDVDDPRSAARSRLVLRIAGLVGWEIDVATGAIIFDDGLAELFCLSTGAVDGSMAAFAARIHDDDREAVLAAFHEATVPGGQYRTEFRIVGDGDDERWLAGVGEGILREDGGISVVGYNCDITDRRAQERALRDAIAQNRLMRLEADHRITNHLQMVLGLIDAQSRAAKSPETVDALGVTMSRINVIARIHRMLSDRQDDDDVDLAAFLPAIVRETVSATDFRGNVDLDVTVPSIACSPGFATNVAHIVAELLTNAVKHGLPDRRLAVHVTVSCDEDRFRLCVEDNGKGLPDDFSMKSGGVGTRVMLALARTLGGSIRPPKSETGATFDFSCPMPKGA